MPHKIGGFPIHIAFNIVQRNAAINPGLVAAGTDPCWDNLVRGNAESTFTDCSLSPKDRASSTTIPLSKWDFACLSPTVNETPQNLRILPYCHSLDLLGVARNPMMQWGSCQGDSQMALACWPQSSTLARLESSSPEVMHVRPEYPKDGE